MTDQTPRRGTKTTGRDGGTEVDMIAWGDGTFTVDAVRRRAPLDERYRALVEAARAVKADHDAQGHSDSCVICPATAALEDSEPGLDLRAVESRGPREVLTAALLRGPGRYSRSGSQALAERLLLALEDAGYVIGEARP